MSLNDPKLAELAGALSAGRITEAQSQELHRLLSTHSGARKAFAQYMQLESMLQEEFPHTPAAVLPDPRKARRAFSWRAAAFLASIAAGILLVFLVWRPITKQHAGQAQLRINEEGTAAPLDAGKVLLALGEAVQKAAPEELDNAEIQKLVKADGAPPLSPSDLKGKFGVVIYFYCGAFRAGCVSENCGFRDYLEEYRKQDYIVLGVSPDNPEKIREFKKIYKLTPGLLSDPGHVLACALHVKPEARDTVVIHKDGSLQIERGIVDPTTHHKKVLSELESRPRPGI